MRILLVNDEGGLVASLENVERYDTRNPSHFARLLDLLESLISGVGSVAYSGRLQAPQSEPAAPGDCQTRGQPGAPTHLTATRSGGGRQFVVSPGSRF